ncbi:hypothetical protein LOTGIDRAFT_93989, partial [Lottia gigantea]
LAKHIKDLDVMLFGLTINDLINLAYDLAVANGVADRFSKEKKSSWKKWYYAFMNRHPKLTLRSPEARTQNRTKGFNRNNVYEFFDKYYAIKVKHGNLEKYNMDETAHSTVQTPSKVVSTKGKRQVRIPLVSLYFKRKRMTDKLKVGAPEGTSNSCTSSCWIDKDVFDEWLTHFIKCTQSSKDNLHLLLLDVHGSHTKNLAEINLARENVIMLPFPPHPTIKIQPQDVSFFKSLKNWYNIEI